MESFCSEIDAQKEMISTPVVWVCRSIILIIMKSIKTWRTVPGEASLWRLWSCQLLQFFTGLLTNTQQFRSQQERQVKSHKYKQMNQSNRSLHTRRKREKKKRQLQSLWVWEELRTTGSLTWSRFMDDKNSLFFLMFSIRSSSYSESPSGPFCMTQAIKKKNTFEKKKTLYVQSTLGNK